MSQGDVYYHIRTDMCNDVKVKVHDKQIEKRTTSTQESCMSLEEANRGGEICALICY